MSGKIKRSFWQLHLSTALVLMLVAGVLLWASTQRQWEKIEPPEPRVVAGPTYQGLFSGWQRGWPFMMQAEPGILENYESVPLQPKWLAANLLVSVAILIAIAALLEYLIRRRSATRAIGNNSVAQLTQ